MNERKSGYPGTLHHPHFHYIGGHGALRFMGTPAYHRTPCLEWKDGQQVEGWTLGNFNHWNNERHKHLWPYIAIAGGP